MLGLAVLAWSPQARGALARTPLAGPPEALAGALAAVATRHGATPGAVSLAWLIGKGVLPVLGARDRAQLEGSLRAPGLRLTDEDRAQLDGAMAAQTYPAALMERLRESIGVDEAMVLQAERGAGPKPAPIPPRATQ